MVIICVIVNWVIRVRGRIIIFSEIMGPRWSNALEIYNHPEDAPRFNHKPKYDPLYGFPNGRKERGIS